MGGIAGGEARFGCLAQPVTGGRSLGFRDPSLPWTSNAAERELLVESQLIVWQHPLMWYSVPALQKLWFDTVLADGWATGEGGTALVGKSCFWVTTTGAPSAGYTQEGAHKFPFAAFMPAIEMTARYCGMLWLPPLVLHGAHQIDDEALHQRAAQYRQSLQAFASDAEVAGG
jgi:glutathione-regulated potassium-efflux system ancillary protein KefF